VETGTVLEAAGGEAADREASMRETRVGELPSLEQPLTLAIGDDLVVTRSTVLGRHAIVDDHGHVLMPATIGCTADEVFEDVRPGGRILFDDGKVGGVVQQREPDRLRVRITRARARAGRLAAEKGINLPDTALRLPALTDKDRDDLRFVSGHADMVALSFVNSAEDIRELRSLLAPLGDAQPAIVLKTRPGAASRTCPPCCSRR
jgi:pyruvate kinase